MCVFVILFVVGCFAQTPIPPIVSFVNGQFTGTLITQGLTVPISGTLEYLQAGTTEQIKTHIVANANGQQIISDTWEVVTATSINSWAISSTDPTTCDRNSLAGDSYPKCDSWKQTGGQWYLSCTVTVSGTQAQADISALVNANKQLLAFQENTTVSGQLLTTEDVRIGSQSLSPPPQVDFNLPALCKSASPRYRAIKATQYPIINGLGSRIARLYRAKNQ